jgi:LmbE family N-acetylglucosaminyl deacetylase
MKNVFMNILAIGAHPDDIELGCSGTLLNHKENGDEIFLLVMTNGENGGEKKLRVEEAKKAAEIIGGNITVLDFHDGEIREDIHLIKTIENYVKLKKIDVMYTHSKNDRHQDHRNIASSCQIAMRFVNECYSYETPVTPNNFLPTMFVDITKNFEKKMLCVNCHITQEVRYYVKSSSLTNMSSFRALNAGFPEKKFESFEVNKIIKK